MRFKPWGTWGALGLICALIVGCNTANRQPEKTLGATTGNPPGGKAISSTGAPAFGTPNNKPFPSGGLPNGQRFDNAPGISPAGGTPNYAAPGSGGMYPGGKADTFTPKNFTPPNTGSSTFGNQPGPQPTPFVGQPLSGFNSDRNTIAPDNQYPGVKLPGQP